MLRSQEIDWLENSFESTENPFDAIGIGYVQSAFHNQSGKVKVKKKFEVLFFYLTAKDGKSATPVGVKYGLPRASPTCWAQLGVRKTLTPTTTP